MSRTRHARCKVEKILIYRRMNSVPGIIRQTHYIVWYRATTQTGKFLWRLQAIQFQEEVLSQVPNLLFFPATRQLESKRCTQTATIAQHLRGLLRYPCGNICKHIDWKHMPRKQILKQHIGKNNTGNFKKPKCNHSQSCL